MRAEFAAKPGHAQVRPFVHSRHSTMTLTARIHGLASAILLGVVGWAQATQVYVDAVAGEGGNTYNNETNSLTDWWVANSGPIGSDDKWGLRTSGPAAVAYGTTCYEILAGETAVTLRLEVTGLAANATYTGIRAYMIGRAADGTSYNWPIAVSLDGVDWITLIDYDAAGYSGNLVDTSDDGVGVIQASTAVTEKRIWYGLPDATTDAAGTLRVYIRRAGGAMSRSVLDGIGYEDASTGTPDPYSDSVYISEFMADNPGPVLLPGSVVDMDDDSSDWIELHNWGATDANLSGWMLTDDPLRPDRWTFPAGTTLRAGARLLVFASGKNRRLNGVELHTNFKLAKSGFLQLARPSPSGAAVVLSAFGSAGAGYAAQNSRASYGSSSVPPAAPGHGYFTTPTPRAANGSNVPGFVGSADTDIDRGLFTAPFTVTLTCPTAGATILYTLDGSVPAEGAAATVAVPPAGPSSTPVGTLGVSTTTILRTRAVKAGYGASAVETHTYLFPAQVLAQSAPPAHFPATAPWSHFGTADWAMDPNIVNHADAASRCTVDDLLSIPSVSLVMDWSELFGTSGLYPAIAPVPEEGLDKAANLELLNADGSTTDPNAGDGFSAGGKTHIFGGTSQDRWKMDKLSFNFNVTGTVGTDVYGDAASGTHNRFILDARMGNTWLHAWDDLQRTRGDYIRDEVAANAQIAMGHAGTHTRRVHFFLNGLYWGVYTLHERPDADFQAAYQGGDDEEWDVLKHNPSWSDCVVSGSFVNPALSATVKTNNTAYVNYQAMLATVASGIDLTNAANYAAVAAKLDLDAFIDYMVLNFAFNNFDWSHQNWYASYRRASPDGRWRFHSWDAEHVLRIAAEERIAFSLSGTGSSEWLTDCKQAGTPTFIHQRLATNADYRMRFADRIQKWCFHDALLTVSGTSALCNDQFDEIDAAIRGESARWGDNRAAARPVPNTGVPYTRGVEWLNEKNRMLDTVIPGRFTVFLEAMKSKSNALYPRVDPADTASAIFHAPVYAQQGGRVPAGYALAITNPNSGLGTVYYTLDGSDPRLPGGALNHTALEYTAPVDLGGSATVRARVRNDAVWSALNEATFSVGTVAPAPANLIVSKIMWKAAEPDEDDILAGFTDNTQFEFLELYNPAASPVDLTGIDFSHGLDIAITTAGAVDLAPGGRAVLVADRDAFRHRYGNAANVVGAFLNDTNLSGSERLTLVDAHGTALSSFIYNNTATNPWPKDETSGTGAALVLIRPESNPNPALGVNWRASSCAGPAPGIDDRPDLAAWQLVHFGGRTDLAADPDADGLPNLVEFALGLDPSGPDDPARRPGITLEDDPVPAILLTFRRQKLLETLDWRVEHSGDLADWSSAPGAVETVSIVDEGDGTETITYRSLLEAGVDARFFRLRLTSP